MTCVTLSQSGDWARLSDFEHKAARCLKAASLAGGEQAFCPIHSLFYQNVHFLPPSSGSMPIALPY
jgi:hypothetical protein